MTKFKFTSLILILSLLVVACGDSNEASSDIATDDEKSVTQTTVESTNEVSEPAVETLTGEILIDGSSTVFPITQAVAEEFTILNPDVKISVGVSGTGGGFKKFCPGETMISNASRAIKDKLVNGVSGSEGGLGYFGLAYYEENKDKLNAVQVDAGNGCQPPEAAFEGNYYLARPLYIYISESVKEDQVVKEFVDFYFEAMDIIVPAVGYVPMLEDQKANALSAWQNFSS